MKKSRPSDVEKLEAPIQLTPAQLETVAAGVAKQVKAKGSEDLTTTSGAQMPTAALLQMLKLS
jgi:hypothetical protein